MPKKEDLETVVVKEKKKVQGSGVLFICCYCAFLARI
jgi:hypothetical protein